MGLVKTPPPALAERLVAASEQVLHPNRDMGLEEIATLVGSKRATLYYYFSGRDDIVAFLLEEHLTAAAAVVATAAGDGPPEARLRTALTGLIEFLGQRPGLCAGLLSFAAATGRIQTVMAAKETMLAAPIRDILDAGISARVFATVDTTDATNAILGALMIATMGRWQRGTLADPAFQRDLTEQLVRSVLPISGQTRSRHRDTGSPASTRRRPG